MRSVVTGVVALTMLAIAPSAHAACSDTRVTSLEALASEVRNGHSACLADGSYEGSVDLSNRRRRTAVVTQEGAAVIHGQVRLNSSYLTLDGLVIENAAGAGPGADCVRIERIGGTEITIADSDIGPCARDAIRMAFNAGQHDTEVSIQGNALHDLAWNGCTCYLRGGLFADNVVERAGNDALNLWGAWNTVQHNVFRDLIPSPPSNHNDVLQTWQIPGDPATGDPLTNLDFERNIIDTVSGPDSHGLLITGGPANAGLTIRSNLFRDIGSIGMLFDGTRDVGVTANTFVRAGGMDTIEWKAGATGTIDSNVFFEAASAGTQPWYQDADSSPAHNYNLAWGGALLAGEDGGLNADPRFYDPGGTRDDDRDDDFALDGSSPAIDHGNPWLTDRIDIDGRPVLGAALDNGAFEYAGG